MKLFKPTFLWIIPAFAPGALHAYVGPGVGLSAIGSVLAFIGAVLLLIVGFLWYPIKRLIKRPDKSPAAGEAESSADADGAQDDGKH